MIVSNNNISDSEKKFRTITGILILAGCVAAAGLVFFFVQLFHARSSSLTPAIYNAEQIGTTDTSVLIAWGHSEAPCEYVIRYKSTKDTQYREFRTEQPFAAIHGLEPYSQYKANITPVDMNGEHDTVSVMCSTAPYCHVTQVRVTDITHDSAAVAWDYEGIDNGFTVIAYAVDTNGKRRLTGDKIKVAPGAGSECLLSNLLSNVKYTVCVMPDTRYSQAAKSTFATSNYSRLYNRFNIIRFVTCTYESTDTMQVRKITNLFPAEKYKASMVYNGPAEIGESVELKLYVTDTDGNLITSAVKSDIAVNPDGVAPYIYRTMMDEFQAPSEPGDYFIYAAIDNVTVTKAPFKVIKQ